MARIEMNIQKKMEVKLNLRPKQNKRFCWRVPVI
jgi:hypothetical protein